jgi:hypothetical protein
MSAIEKAIVPMPSATPRLAAPKSSARPVTAASTAASMAA